MTGDPRSTWFRLSAQEAAERLSVDPQQGLSSQQASTRLAEVGPNALVEMRRRSLVAMAADQFRSALIILLVVAAAVSAAIGDVEDAIAILAIVVLNAALGVRQEFKAEEAMAALKKLSTPTVRVRRDGKLLDVPSEEVVPGDIVVLEAGTLVPADLRLLETSSMRTEEAPLTGESQPVDKDASAVCDEEAALGDRINMAYRGTTVVYGRGVGLVAGTGMRTELGRIADLIQGVKSDPTPLQKRLDRLGRVLVGAALGIVAVVLAVGLSQGQSLQLMFLTAVSLAVAAAPEGLPAVATIALALGARRMLARNALIRRLPAVETLGSVTCICSDKTGTLTQNRMQVKAVLPSGDEAPLAVGTEATTDPTVRSLLATATLANDAELEAQSGEVVGEPTEVALVEAARDAGLDKNRLEREFERIAEAPFDSERKRMSTLHRLGPESREVFLEELTGGAPLTVLAKGAFDSIAQICSHRLVRGSRQPLEDSDKEHLAELHDRIASQGMRVLAFAARPLAEAPADDSAEALERDLTFLGIAALMDPARPEAKTAVESCERAGIRTVMITGDHPATARHIADELGVGNDGELVTGAELDRIDDGELEERIDAIDVFARVSPQHKLRIVDALQAKGQVVAMTGDGVNDAPALKTADIGVAMGVVGSDVSREAADVVLRDDNFATIVAAVEEGRVIFDNIRKFVKFLLSANSGELWVMLCGPLAGMPLPLLPIQILWMNLITDGLPALALGVEPPEEDVMNRPPHDPEEGVFSRGVGRDILWTGLAMGATALAVGWGAWSNNDESWQTMLFTTLTLAQLFLALAVRSEKRSLFTIGLTSNLYMAAAVAGSIVLQLGAVYAAPLQSVLDTVPLSGSQLAVCAAAGTLPFWLLELEKLLLRARAK